MQPENLLLIQSNIPPQSFTVPIFHFLFILLLQNVNLITNVTISATMTANEGEQFH